MNEDVVTRVLLTLWKRPETTVGEVAREVGRSVETVGEAIEELRARKCLIERTPSGVRLAGTGLGAWRDVLENCAREGGWRIGKKVIVLAKTGSTNDVAWEHATADGDGVVVCADEQTAGRGRFGHVWAAKAEQSVLMSVLLRMESGVDESTLLAGLATARAVEKIIGARVAIKWPNDVLVGEKKLAGILVDRRGEFCVVGIGVNVGQADGDFPPEVRERATSLYLERGEMADRLRVLVGVVEELEKWVGVKQKTEEWIGEWKSRCEMLGRRVAVRSRGERVEGLVVDVDPLRGLVLRDDAGVTRMMAAETTALAV